MEQAYLIDQLSNPAPPHPLEHINQNNKQEDVHHRPNRLIEDELH